jgi:hypothetical protein
MTVFASLNFKREALHINRISSSHHDTALLVTSLIYTRHVTSLHFTSLICTQSPLEFTLLVTVFLTLFLKVLNEQGKDVSKPAGN